MAIIKKISIKIGGEVGKYNTLPVDYLVNLAKHLQDLIQDIANYDLPSDEPIDLNNFKLELSKFGKGSAVPTFIFTHNVQNTIITDVEMQREVVTEKFSELMSISDVGDYLQLRKQYPEPAKRNKITHSLYEFVNSVGDSPASILDNRNKPLYKIRPFQKNIHDKIITEIIKSEAEKKAPEKHIQLAKVEVIEGKARPKVLELFDRKYNHVEYAPEVIVVGEKIYELRFPLLCTMETEEGQIRIENKMLGIYAFGSTPDEAELMFSEEFDYLFERYNELADNKLTEDVKAIKSFLNHIIKK